MVVTLEVVNQQRRDPSSMSIPGAGCRALLILLSITIASILIACATPRIRSLAQYTVGSIPETTVDLKSKVRRLGILHPEYRGREDYKNGAQRILTGVGQWPVALIERSELDKVVQEQAIGMTGLISPTTAAKAGKILGVDHILTYSVDATSDEDIVLVGRRGGSIFADVAIKVINTETAEVIFQYVGTAAARLARPAAGSASTYEAEAKPLRRMVIAVSAYLVWEAINAAFERPRLGFLGDAAYEGKGARIFIVIPGGNAERAGVQREDILVKFGDREISSDGDLDSIIRTLGRRSQKDIVPITVLRNSRPVELTLSLGSR